MLRRRRLLEQQQRLEQGIDDPLQDENQRRRKAGPEVQRACVAVPLPVTPTPGEVGALLKTLVKHLLFQRAQIPYLYDQLLYAAHQQRHAQESAAAAGGKRRRQRLPKGDRRLLKFLGKTEEVFASIDAALAAFGVPSRCFLLLGASTSKPREAFEVVLPAAAVGTMHPPAPPAAAAAAEGEQTGPAAAAPDCDPEQQQQQAAVAPGGGRPRASRQERLCQLALRQLVVAGAELPEGTAHTATCKLFVLLEGSSSGAPGGSSSSGAAASCASSLPPVQHSVELTAASTSGAAAPRGFAVKRNFRLTMRKGVHVTLLLGRRPEELQPAAAAAAENGGGTTAAVAAAGECGSAEGSQGDEVPTIDLSQLPDAEPLSQEAAPPPPLDAAQAGTTAAAAAAAAAAAGSAAPGSVWYLCKAVIKGMNQNSEEQPEG